MAGFIANEGNIVIGNCTFLNTGSGGDRGTGLKLGLFTNSTGVNTSITWSSITQVSGSGYAEINLTDANWINTNGVMTYTGSPGTTTFTATGTWSAPVYGYYIRTAGSTARLLAAEIDTSGPYSFVSGDTYAITPTITIL